MTRNVWVGEFFAFSLGIGGKKRWEKRKRKKADM
jgi:hypothetical protein